ncbi:General control protein [Sporothrix epigloea]|uniref:General control protein n=1 Tax=Sporothrix epigloea TaxID=1892477 RepID=A0ABP0DRW1_9PEZI
MVLEGSSTPPPLRTSTQKANRPSLIEDLQGLGSDSSTMAYNGALFPSPALSAVYDLNSSVSSSSASNMGTVSPTDLLLHDPFASAPNSTALTVLTSPSDFDSSPHDDSFDVSPAFGCNDHELAGHDAWYPLFPQDKLASVSGNSASHADLASPMTQLVDEMDDQQTASGRRKSGHSRSPSTSHKHSASAGVNASRRREKPLPPIIVDDPTDIVAMKRARNTLAARKSRERKAIRVEELEEKIAKLEAERDHWKKMALGQ